MKQLNYTEILHVSAAGVDAHMFDGLAQIFVSIVAASLVFSFAAGAATASFYQAWQEARCLPDKPQEQKIT